MSKRCPDCGFVNEDSRIYCSSCGELLDSELRLIKDLQNQKNVPSTAEEPVRRRNDDDDDDYIPPKTVKKKESNSTAWVVLALAAAAVIIVMFLMK